MALHAGHATASWMNFAPADPDPRNEFRTAFLEFLPPLHRRFTPWLQKLVAKRAAAPSR
jgi:hypothetical protein